MKNHRSLLLAIIIAVSGLFAFQPAGAVDDLACTNIGPQPFRIATWAWVRRVRSSHS